jgi:dipeptidyl aminopeptidase/acylaminoacyl peptidase
VALRVLQGSAVLLLVAALAPAQAEVKPQAPRVNYKQALKYSSANLAQRTYSTAVMPGWIGKTDSFWYSYKTSKGTAFYRVDPAKKTKTALFDAEKLGGQLAELSRKPVDSTALPITRGRVTDDGGKFSFVFAEMLYEYDLKAEKLASKGKAPAAPPAGPGGRFGGRRRLRADADEVPQVKKGDKDNTTDRTKGRAGAAAGRGRNTRAVAPDKKAYLYTRDNNLYLAETGKEKEAVQLCKDGAEDYGFILGFGFAGGGRFGAAARAAAPPRSFWSKDSKHFYALRQDNRGIKELFVINSLANPRPTLEKYKYALPGEEVVRKSELHVGSRAGKKLVRVKPKWKDEYISDLHWGKSLGELRFVRQDRLRRNLELCSVNAETGECKALIAEGFDNAPVDHQPPRYLEETDEMIWWSEKSGWGHYYLCDRQGKVKNAITSGSWRASRIVDLDARSRILYLQGNGREKGENVYYQHLYSVHLDGTGLSLLDTGNASHFSSLSPTRRYVVDNCSRIDGVPQSVLRDARGARVMDLETADLSRLTEFGWRLPQTFTVKAADGVTDLYGNLWKPFDFDPKKKYPLIAHVYPGPQTEGVTHTFAAYSTNMQLAQLGFIVIQVGHRGGTPLRSKAYASYGYFNLRDYGLADKKSAIEQLAARHSWIDLKNVGIYGHSGGGFMSAAALLQKPYNQFFKAAVASAGNHDNNVYNHTWAERYHGMREVVIKEETKDKTKGRAAADARAPAAPPARQTAAARDARAAKAPPAAPPPPKTKFEIKVPTNAELAANLKGRLLLVHGEIDNNVHPANTMRLVEALIKANKRFDLLIIPGAGHGFGPAMPYFQQRMWEFFAEHLLGDCRRGADIYDKESE